MRPTSHILRDDDRFIVIVGWDYDLESFYAYVHDARSRRLADPGPVLNVGRTPHEMATISELIAAVSRFAPLQPEVVSSLRREAAPLDATAAPHTYH